MIEVPFVSSDRLLSIWITLFLCILFPIALWIVLAVRKKRISTAVLAGALGFIVPQMLIRLPILRLLSLNQSWTSFCANNVTLSYIIFASTAAFVETAGRLVSLRGLLHKRLSYDTALGAGLGHGGVESIGLIGFAYINNIVISHMINTNTLPDIPELQAVVSALTQTQPGVFLLAGFERIFTIMFHMLLTTILCLFIMRKDSAKGLFLVFLLHFALDFFIPSMAAKGVNMWVVEGILCLVAVICVVMMVLLKQRYTAIESPRDPASVALDEGY